MLNKVSVDDMNVKGQRVLVRCDFNVPLQDGKITDENRLVASLPTIKKLIADGGKVILCSHLGKPKGEAKPELSLAPVAVRLSELLGQDVKFAALLYISDQDKYPLQLVLRNILITNQTALSQTATTAAARAALQEQQQLIDVMKYSLIIISSVPVLIMYPLV